MTAAADTRDACPRCGDWIARQQIEKHIGSRRCQAQELYNEYICRGFVPLLEVYTSDYRRCIKLIKFLDHMTYQVAWTRFTSAPARHVWTTPEIRTEVETVIHASAVTGVPVWAAARHLKDRPKLIRSFAAARALGADDRGLRKLLGRVKVNDVSIEPDDP